MRGLQIAAVCWGVIVVQTFAGDQPMGAASNWGQWRGPTANGVAPHGDPPLVWSESKNVRWKVEIPGDGIGTPIVWGDRVYVQTAIPTKSDTDSKPADEEDGRGQRRGMRNPAPTAPHKFVIMAFDRDSGERVWQHVVREEVPHEGCHPDGSLAPCSPATDGEHLIAHFGSRGTYGFDMQGKLLWENDFGDMRTRNGFGEGGAPAIRGDTVVITWDHEGESFIVAMDKKTGKEKWRKNRDEPSAWTTPMVVEVDGKPQVVVNGANRIRSYDLATGREVWNCGGMTKNVVPAPLLGDGLLYFTSGFRGSALLAIDYKRAEGDVTGSERVVWTYGGEGTPYVPSPLLSNDVLYFLNKNKAMLSCVDARTGSPHYANQRLEGLQGVYASPVSASGRVYIAGRSGKTVVLEDGPEFKVLAENDLDDSFSASPAVVGGQLFLRGLNSLYCIEAR